MQGFEEKVIIVHMGSFVPCAYKMDASHKWFVLLKDGSHLYRVLGPWPFPYNLATLEWMSCNGIHVHKVKKVGYPYPTCNMAYLNQIWMVMLWALRSLDSDLGLGPLLWTQSRTKTNKLQTNSGVRHMLIGPTLPCSKGNLLYNPSQLDSKKYPSKTRLNRFLDLDLFILFLFESQY